MRMTLSLVLLLLFACAGAAQDIEERAPLSGDSGGGLFPAERVLEPRGIMVYDNGVEAQVFRGDGGAMLRFSDGTVLDLEDAPAFPASYGDCITMVQPRGRLDPIVWDIFIEGDGDSPLAAVESFLANVDDYALDYATLYGASLVGNCETYANATASDGDWGLPGSPRVAFHGQEQGVTFMCEKASGCTVTVKWKQDGTIEDIPLDKDQSIYFPNDAILYATCNCR